MGDQDNFDLTDGQTSSSGLIVAGEYIVTELVTAGWDFIAVDCVVTSSLADPDNGSTFSPSGTSSTVTLEPGDTVTCTFDNTQRGQIVVNKTIADGAAVGDALLQTFDFDVDGVSAVGAVITDETVTLDGNGDDADGNLSSASYEVRPGSYSVAETLPADWQLDSVVCTDAQDPAALTVVPGATIECTFTNSPDPADVEIDKTLVNVASDYPWSFDFTIAPVTGRSGRHAGSRRRGARYGDDRLDRSHPRPGVHDHRDGARQLDPVGPRLRRRRRRRRHRQLGDLHGDPGPVAVVLGDEHARQPHDRREQDHGR